jgi:ubiquinone/menaquinone biosynthesis C-methylase UbiE
MGANYKNWIPKGMIVGLAAGTAVLAAGTAATLILGSKYDMNTTAKAVIAGIAGVGALGCLKATQWSISAYNTFSYNGKRKMSKQIIDGTAEYVKLPEGGLGLDVGCGSGALTIACAKRNPQGKMIGIDRWGREYKSFSKQLCEDNAVEEGVDNVEFRQGDACKLDFPDEYFDAVTSNYVYHNITGKNKQELLKETLRVLKKGGTFAIHDIMSKGRYGDMQKFVNELYDEGYEKVRLIDTTDGKFMTKWESRKMMLAGSSLLVGVK